MYTPSVGVPHIKYHTAKGQTIEDNCIELQKASIYLELRRDYHYRAPLATEQKID